MRVIIVMAAVVSVIVIGSVLAPAISSAEDESNALDIILIEGQSNAENWLVGTTLDELDETIGAPSKGVFYSANVLDSGNFSEVDKDYSVRRAYDDGWKVGGYIAPLGKLWADKYHRDVLFINTGIGASSIDKLSPDGIFWGYVAEMIETALESDLVASYPEINKIGWIWCQGEFDPHSVDEYKGYFLSLQSAMDSYGFSKCYYIRTRMADSNNSLIAMDSIIRSDSNVSLGSAISDFFTVTNGRLYYDNTHYSQLGRNMIAADLIDVMDAPYNMGTQYIAVLKSIIPIVIIGIVAIFGGYVIYRNRD